ncbi:MAG: hypothetical protein H3C48_15185 [Chitinophagaceae bacterium]|nr:hypothetical protein [Chitinophagaceae bacterium]
MEFVGIDIGTSSICGVLYNPSTREIKSRRVDNTTAIVSEYNWEKIQDAGQIVSIVMDIVNGFVTNYPDIGGIGVTGQMHGILYIGEEGRSVSPLYTWQDYRGNLIYQNLETYAQYLSNKSAYPLSPGFGLVTHYYNIVNGLVPADASKLCTIMDYVVMKLTGNTAPITDDTNGAGLGFFDLQQLQFDKEALQRVGIDPEILPELKDSGSRVGYYNHIPVFAALGDNQASFIGSVQDKDSSIHITIGTSSQISVYSEAYVSVKGLDTRPFPGGGYILVGAGLSGGQSLEILKRFFEKSIKLFAKDKDTEIGFYEVLNSFSPAGANRHELMVHTLFNGTRLDPFAKGSILQISADNFNPENLMLGFVQGICRELHDFYTAVPDYLKNNKVRIVGSGNALEKNKLLGSVLEKTFGLPVQRSPYSEEAALGAAFLAMQGHE